jgi:RepB DNA-primase from phage plasmid
MTVAVDEDTVREFVTIISEHADELAKSNGKSGVLQLTRLSPIDGKLVPSRFKLDDIDGMVRAAVADANAKHNVYIEGRTVRSDLRGAARGPLADTEFVFGLVIDADHDKGKEGAITVRPSLTIETSPGNSHYWYLLTQPLAAGPAKTLGNAIRVAVGADHDTGVVSQPYRVAGTPNFPSKAKRARHRGADAHRRAFRSPMGSRRAASGVYGLGDNGESAERGGADARRGEPARRALAGHSRRRRQPGTRREGGQVALRTLPPRGGRTQEA